MKTTKAFSCLTVSKRDITGWLELAVESVLRQTVQPKQWIIVHEDVVPAEVKDTYDWITFVKAPVKIRLCNLEASTNAGLKLIDTDYVVFYQDFIELQEDCFEKLINLADEKTWVTTCTPNYDGTDDGRYTGADCPRPCRPEEWEINVGIAPMVGLRALGGFDERLDNGWAWGNALLARKAAMTGAKFIIDESNRPKLYPHEMGSHNTLPKNGELCERIMRRIRNGEEPLNCGHL